MSTNAIETLKFNCTTCPSECLLTVEVERDADGAVAEVRSVTGNSCPRGDRFAHQELTCPMRVLTTTVAVSGSDEVLLPVRTAEAIPLELHAQAMALIRISPQLMRVRMGYKGVSQSAGIKGTSLCAGLGIPWWHPSERMFHGTCR